MNVRIINDGEHTLFSDLRITEAFVVIDNKYHGDPCIKTEEVTADVCNRSERFNAFNLRKNRLVYISRSIPVKKLTDLNLTASLCPQ